jgi:hypothetical protein
MKLLWLLKATTTLCLFPGHGAMVCEPNTDQW